MDAAVGVRAPQRCFVAGAVDVNIARVRINVAAAVKARLQPFQPQNAVRNGSQRLPLPCETDDLRGP